MKDKILNWINENCFTDKALIAVNVWEIVFYLYCIRLYSNRVSHINTMNPDSLRSLINIYIPFSIDTVFAFILLIIASFLMIYRKWNYWIWIFKISTFFSLIFFLTINHEIAFAVIIMLIIFYSHWKSFEKFVEKERENWLTFFYVISLIAIYFGLWIGFHSWFY